MQSFKRTDRVASLIQETLSSLLLTEVRDPRVKMVTITHVRVTPDMGLARINVRAIDDSADSRKKLMAGLESSKSYLRKALGERIRLLRVPRLEFFYDEFPDEVARVEQILYSLSADKPSEDVVSTEDPND